MPKNYLGLYTQRIEFHRPQTLPEAHDRWLQLQEFGATLAVPGVSTLISLSKWDLRSRFESDGQGDNSASPSI